MKKIIFFANNNVGYGLSGGDTIFTQFIKNWQDKLEISLVGSEEAIAVAGREGVGNIEFIQTDTPNIFSNHHSFSALIIHTFRRTSKAMVWMIRNWSKIKSADYVYNVSDFYPDFWPAFIAKTFQPKIQWFCGYYLIAPTPWDKTTPYQEKSIIKGIFYWLMQRPTFWLSKKFADKILVTSEDEKNKFIKAGANESSLVVVRGGVDIKPSEKYLNSGKIIPVEKRKYDACFVGRFHEQKGVLKLVDIWKLIVKNRPKAKLAMIGDGGLMKRVKSKIKKLKLEDNIDLLGFQIGEEKFDVFKNSKIILHPATFDSGGMAAAEGMAWKLPAVGFDLPSLKTYYPRGMLKAELNNLDDFIDKILLLLNDKEIYQKVSNDAYKLIINQWNWSSRANQIYNQIINE